MSLPNRYRVVLAATYTVEMTVSADSREDARHAAIEDFYPPAAIETDDGDRMEFVDGKVTRVDGEEGGS